LSIRTQDSLPPESISNVCDFTAYDNPGLARQITEGFPWNEAPRYLIRDRDRAYGAAFTRRLRAIGIPAKILALAVEVIELHCCLLRCGGLLLAHRVVFAGWFASD
jgi:hypothetical protein